MTVEELPPTGIAPVIDAISILMAWRTLGDFRARVTHTLGADDPREYDLTMRPRVGSYRLVDVATGRVDSFDNESREIVAGNETSRLEAHMLVFEPLPVRLAIPTSLGIWGRSFDDYRIDGGYDTGDHIVLTLVHTRASDVVGTLTVSRPERKAVRLDTPTQSIRYESVEPLSG